VVKEYALTINLVNDPGKIEQYRTYHRHVWPEVRECLKAAGIINMDIYLLGRRLFMLLHARDEFDPDRDFDTLLTLHPRYKEWQDTMDTFQERVPEAKDGEHWAVMEQVFRLS